MRVTATDLRARHAAISGQNDYKVRAVGAASARMAYDAADRKAWDARWSPQDETPDAELARDLPRLRERCIDLVRNDPLAYGVVDKIAVSVVGTGPRIRSLAKSQAVRERIESLLWDWSKRAGWDGVSSLARVCYGAVHASLMSGDVGILWPDVGDGTEPKIDLVDARRIASPTDSTPDASSSRLGVGYDKYGRVVGLYIAKGEASSGNRDNFRWYPRIKNGRINAHLFRRPGIMRPRQSRATPMFAPAALDLKDLREYRRTETRRAQAASKNTLAIETPDPKSISDAFENITLEGDVSADGIKELLGRSYGTMPDGNMIVLGMGEKATPIQPPPVNGGVGSYMDAMARAISGCTGLPHEEAMSFYHGLNFSNARTIRLMAKTVYGVWRMFISDELLAPTVELLVRYWWATGALGRIPWSADLVEHETHWDAQEYVDPVKETSANSEGMATGQKSIVEVCAERGRDWRQVLDENLQAEAYEMERRKALGLPPREVKANSAIPAIMPEEPPNAGDDPNA